MLLREYHDQTFEVTPQIIQHVVAMKPLLAEHDAALDCYNTLKYIAQTNKTRFVVKITLS